MKAVPGLSEEQLAATCSPGTLINSGHHPGPAECIGTRWRWPRWSRWGFSGSRSGMQGPARGSTGTKTDLKGWQ